MQVRVKWTKDPRLPEGGLIPAQHIPLTQLFIIEYMEKKTNIAPEVTSLEVTAPEITALEVTVPE